MDMTVVPGVSPSWEMYEWNELMWQNFLRNSRNSTSSSNESVFHDFVRHFVPANSILDHYDASTSNMGIKWVTKVQTHPLTWQCIGRPRKYDDSSVNFLNDVSIFHKELVFATRKTHIPFSRNMFICFICYLSFSGLHLGQHKWKIKLNNICCFQEAKFELGKLVACTNEETFTKKNRSYWMFLHQCFLVYAPFASSFRNILGLNVIGSII